MAKERTSRSSEKSKVCTLSLAPLAPSLSLVHFQIAFSHFLLLYFFSLHSTYNNQPQLNPNPTTTPTSSFYPSTPTTTYLQPNQPNPQLSQPHHNIDQMIKVKPLSKLTTPTPKKLRLPRNTMRIAMLSPGCCV